MAPTGSAKVIINGGGIAGLVLANALSRQGIDFIVLEAGADIAPCVGAGICILPSGARILDQLGMFDDLHDLGGEIQAQRIWRENGSLLGHTDSLKLLHIRQGCPMIFIERKILLQVLFDHLKEKDRIFLGKRIVGVDSSHSRVQVRCTDGSSYTGSIAVGADGIHSTTRREMWRHLEKDHVVGTSSVQNEEKTLSAQYSAVFGIATPTPNMVEGHVNRTFANGYSFFNGVGKDERIFWFVFHDMGRKYQGLNIPRMNQSEIDQHVKPLLDNYVAGGVRFRDIYRNTVRCAHVPMEEGVFDRWVYQRFACIGDSVHKTTPNLGQGGNGAIESAASLANKLGSIFSTKEVSDLPLAIIEDHLGTWAKSRMQRMKLLCEFGNGFTRLEAGKTFVHRLLGRLTAAYKGDTLADLLCETTVGAETLSFLPLPTKSLTGTMPFDKRRGMGASKGKYGPLMYCSALLLCILAIHFTMKPGSISPMGNRENNTHTGSDLEVKTWNFESNSSETLNHHTGSLGLWQSLQLSDPTMAIFFFMDLAIFEVIWTIESIRSGNAMTLLNW
ncbi:FAD/NAD(P)-binding domain-containing protein [Aspergillus steynii IBT 23096]|uniref:FAD/NAD(P)-binding domain-containing protein n=1 Tax=Aspergillus steynii IBT 23096 TaxID=1392250 RepID=A0A2I2G7C6_9EURO|nr:FAD/NAD(P)-binding domain-containing protein [Aspergillus steynii IBT 23096]PLB48782.1 FAD/NAD(P)-binding domain-containing protein [Aspergillus steynii IBT 23096]